MRVLVVEDEQALANAIYNLFRSEGMETDVMDLCSDGIDAAMTGAYDCIVTDVMLPDGNGIEMVNQLRHLGCDTPILVLTAFDDTKSRVNGLNAGADDFVGKPFEPSELVARIEALVRRSGVRRELDILERGNAVLHRKSRTLQVDSRILELSAKEFMLLEYLWRHAGQVLTRDQLISHVWGPDAEVADNALDTYIYFLRQKCANVGLKQFIKTVRGQGYMMK